MKKLILLLTVISFSFAVKAQSSDKKNPTKSKTEYSFVWGLFKSKNFSKKKSTTIELEKSKLSTSLSLPSIDSTKYEQKSILWGAIQWTEKKNDISDVKAQSNEK